MSSMRKRGGRDRGFYTGHSEHDDRTQVSPSDYTGPRRVSFKNAPAGEERRGYRGGRDRRKSTKSRQRGWDNKMKSALLDNDVDMITVRTNDRVYQNKKSRPGGVYYRDMRRALGESPSHWYKVTIRHGQKYEKAHVLKVLANYLKPATFIPYGYKVAKDETSFVVEDRRTAEELMNADRKISMPDGWKLMINVRPMTPYVEVDDALTSIIKKAMSARYNLCNKSLSLAKFHADPVMMQESLFCPLNRPNIMIAVMGIIGESIPDLQALDLSENKINSTDHLKMLLDKAPNIKTLYIGNNKLRDIKQLDALKGLPVEELTLDGNSLCDKFHEKETYIRSVRQRFPKVVKLDGVDLPPPILFDIEDEGRLPGSKASFMADPSGANIVKQFLEQYYQIYDSQTGQGNGAPGRAPLIQAYHEQAVFSLDAYQFPNDMQSISVYLPDCRNLLKVPNKEQRLRLLRRGQQNVVEAITSLPKTIHDPASFTVDLVLFMPQLMQVCVAGIFKEVSLHSKRVLIRYFSRVFIIVPVGSGFCVVNDQLTIMPATSEQARKAFKGVDAATTQPEAQPQQPQPEVPTVSLVPPGIPADPDILAKQQMVIELSNKTGMNLMWSEKCLVEMQWNFNQALTAFTESHKRGAIPSDAFIKTV